MNLKNLWAGRLHKADVALTEIEKYNPIRNDLDAYLYDIAEWGLGIIPDKPNPKDFGVE